MKMKVPSDWTLIWYCSDCTAFVGCHEGTDLPFGFLGGYETRKARHAVHQQFDRLWRGGGAPMGRLEAYAWFANALNLPIERAHISMLNAEQCERLGQAVETFFSEKRHLAKTNGKPHWKQLKRKKRR